MKISLNWLKEYIEIKESPEDISEVLTQTGLEVEGIVPFHPFEGGLEGVVIGKVLTCVKHPNADKLKVTSVDVGDKSPLHIVCGGPNVAAGQKVLVALVGATLYPFAGDPFTIKRAKIRGEESVGMICAEDELGIGESHEGVMVLDTDLPPGTPATKYFKVVPDHTIEIGLTPNRADAVSHIGVARDLKAYYDRNISWPDVKEFKPDSQDRPIRVRVENPEACPRYSGVVLTGLSIKSSPDWLQTRLKSIGLHPINAVVDVTNFVCHELGQPLHAFDADKIVGDEIIVKTLPKGTKFTTLDEVERELNTQDLMICNAQEGMCIAGVFGGIKSGVTARTTSIFLEGAYFSPDYVRKTSMAHGLKTDASFRFERGTDPRITVLGVQRAALLIKEICGGQIASDLVDIYPEKIENRKIEVKFKHIDRLIGQQLAHKTIFGILNRLDIEVVSQEDDKFRVSVPPYRVDVTREADIIEEVLRIYGFNNIEIPPHSSSTFVSEFPDPDMESIQFKTSEILAAMGFNEVITNSLTKQSYTQSNNFVEEKKKVEILNKLSEELGVLRQDMVFTALESVAYNINRKQKNLKFFEFGKTYFKKQEGWGEKKHLILMMTGEFEDENWINKARQLEFHDLSSVVEKILNKFNIANAMSDAISDELFGYGLKISLNGKEIVAFGKLVDTLTHQVNINQAVWYARFDWEYLVKQSKKSVDYKELSKYPEVRRDLSLVLDKNITFDQIKQIAERSERKLLRRINVFDVYEGNSVGENKKAYAIKFILQDQNKTLTDKAIDKTMSRLMQSFEQELGAIIRK